MEKKTNNDVLDSQILELKKVIEQQKEEISQLKTIIDDIPADVYWKRYINKKLVYSGMNRTGIESLKKMGFKWNKEDILGKTDENLFDKQTSCTFIKNDLEVINSGIAHTKEETAVLPSGKKIIQLSTKRPLLDNQGNLVGIAGVSIDISELKETQSALQIALEKAKVSDKTKTEFLENMRHDIRTPLTGIVGCAEALQSAHDPRQITEYAKDLTESSNALLDFLNNILEGIQIATGEIPLVKKKFDLRKQIEEIIRLNKSLAADKKLTLSLNYDKSIPLYLIGDPIRVQRIVLELLTNALMFTKRGQVTVNVKLKEKKSREVIIEIAISDTGIGIPKDKQKEIFLRFKRLTPSYKGIYKGLGLGLTTVKQFIDDLGGEIYVNSRLGEGTTFTCFISFQEPLVMEDVGVEEIPLLTQPNKLSKKEFTSTGGHQFTEPSNTIENRILLVEDDVLAAKAAQNVMSVSSLNCTIDRAPDAKTAMELLQQHAYQLILMDIGLPDMDGIALTHRVRLQQWQSNHATVPIIGLTAHIGQERKQQCLDAGMNAVILKPLNKETAKELLTIFVKTEKSHKISTSNTSVTKGAVLDFNEIKKTFQNEELIEECRKLVVKALSEDLVKLAVWYEDTDWENITVIAHKWKGGASYYGAKRLEQACQIFCEYWDSGKKEEFKNLYQQMIQEMEAVRDICINKFQ